MKLKRTVTFLFSFLVIVYFETVLRIFTIGSFDSRFIYTVVFALPVALLVHSVTMLSRKSAAKIAYNLIITVFSVYFSVQLVYYAVFGGFLSVSMMGMGGDVMNNFAAQTITAIKASAVGIIFLFLPLLVSIVLTCKGWLTFDKAEVGSTLTVLACFLVAHMLALTTLPLGGTDTYTVYDIYYSDKTPTTTSVKNLGVTVTTRLEIKKMIKVKLGMYEEVVEKVDVDRDKIFEYWGKGEEYNSLDIDFDSILDSVDEGTHPATLTGMVSNIAPTAKNQYTGMFEGYNLITICAESFSNYLIDPELTPTLYKLSTEGFVFENYYSSFESITTDGEFSFCTGLYPDPVRNAVGGTSFLASKSRVMPYTLGNMFAYKGVVSYGYHNNNGTFYQRNETHTNMGYDFRTPDNGIDMEVGWPSSDLEMIEATIDDYITSGKQFHAYYMTFSGHYQYNWDNPMSARHRDKVEHLDYSEDVKAYIACNLEVEYMLSYLLERLEEEGIADKTVIVLTNDHYPYGLSEQQYNELAGKPVDPDFEKYRNSFICWSGSMEEPVYVDKLCSTVDILPTILNLFGFEYDSRLLAGRDVLSDSEGIAILVNERFITDKYMFNAVDNEVIMLTDEQVSEEEINADKKAVRDRFLLSKYIIDGSYYQYVEKYIAEANQVK